MLKQHRIPGYRPEVRTSDVKAVQRTMQSGHLSQGLATEAFETAFAHYLGARYATAVSNGTAGLHLSLCALGVGPNDEVLTTPFSYVASVNAILYVGARPVFVDIEADTYNLDPSKLAAAMTKRSRAILLVHALGLPCDMRQILPVASQFNLATIEDASEALGASVGRRKVGTLGTIGVFSFFASKQLTMGEGGAVVTNNERLTRLVRSLRHQGRPMRGEPDGYARLGFNYKVTDVQAALGLSQLQRLNGILLRRQRIVDWYLELLRDVEEIHLPSVLPAQLHPSWFSLVVRLNDSFRPQDRSSVLSSMYQEGIDCANYFPPLHLQPFLRRKFRFGPGMYPVCEQVAARTIALPVSSTFRRPEIERVATALKESIRKLHPSVSGCDAVRH